MASIASFLGHNSLVGRLRAQNSVQSFLVAVIQLKMMEYGKKMAGWNKIIGGTIEGDSVRHIQI